MENEIASKKFYVYYGVITIAVLLNVIRLGNLPGLYMDAVNPDYFAVQLLHPSDNPILIVPYIGVPLLGQVYHGTITTWVSAIVILITGQTSVLQLHIANAVYGIIICILLFRLFLRIKIHRYISAGIVLLLATSPNLFSMYCTQLYIELPGICFTLITIWKLMDWNTSLKNIDLLMAGVLAGLAFYSYFNYLFCLPGYIIAIIYYTQQKSRETITINCRVALTGFILGASPFAIGYLGYALTMLPLSNALKCVILLSFSVVGYGICIGYYKMQVSKQWDFERKNFATFSYFGVSILFALIVIIYFRQKIAHVFSLLNVVGNKAGLGQKLWMLLDDTNQILCNTMAENLLLGKPVSIFTDIVKYVLVALLVVTVILIFRKKVQRIKVKIFMSIFISLLLYYTFSMILASRMQPQHFVMMLFAEYALLAITIDIVMDVITVSFRHDILLKRFGCILFIGGIALNFINQNVIIDKLVQSGGYRLYTEDLNKLAEDAKNNLSNGGKELYIFPEWGFISGFDYLTMNKVRYITKIDAEYCQKMLEQGYTIKLCCWNYEDYQNPDQLKEQLERAVGEKAIESQLVNKSKGEDIIIFSVGAKA